LHYMMSVAVSFLTAEAADVAFAGSSLPAPYR